MVKGPDLFLEAVEKLARDFPVFVLLTGPARGYVKTGLDEMGVPYAHHFLDDYLQIVSAYHALDLYLMTSREEGGPKAILECAATGVPLVSSRVGMAPDVITDGATGFLVEVGDTVATVQNPPRSSKVLHCVSASPRQPMTPLKPMTGAMSANSTITMSTSH